jgi:Fe2+ transport system protein FeoA
VNGPDGIADEALPLDRLEPGKRGIITRLGGDPTITRRLMELGLVPGTTVVMVRHAPLGDPIELAVRGVRLSLRRTEASHIHVAPR